MPATRREQQLVAVREELASATAAVERLASAASDEVWHKRPPSGGWSAAECIAHLTLTTEVYMPLLGAALAGASADGLLPARYRMGFVAWLLAKSLEPPARARVKTQPQFVPNANASKAESVAAFRDGQRALLEWMDRAAAHPLDRMRIQSPFSSRMRYNAYAAMRVLAAHQRRHIWQAERAMRGIP
jgi:hypothetical protein